MARHKRGRQTRRSVRIRWGRFISFLAVLLALGAAIYFLIQLLSGNMPPGGVKPTPPPTIPLVEALPTPETTPEPILGDVTIAPGAGTSPADFGFSTGIMASGEEVEEYRREADIRFGTGAGYTSVPGILTFGGNNYRNTFTYGTQTLSEKTLERAWELPTGSLNTSLGTWTGTGWTGMPVIVEWPEQTRRVLGVYDEFQEKDGFVEVIYPAMDGYIYFMELSTGNKTREPLKLGVTTKGTASLDPRGYPLLYSGQGIPESDGAWFRVIDLIKNEVIWRFGGVDGFAHRKFQAYDSSALLDANTDTLIAPGENGVLYTVKLNSQFDPELGTVSIDPEGLVKYRYTGDGYGFNDEEDRRWPGIENSIAMYRNYGFFTDNGGRLQCLDLNTMELQYVVDVTDDSDSSIVIEENPQMGTFYLYTANEVDKQQGAAAAGTGKSYHRKIDGRTGKILWEKEWDAGYGGTSSNGGTLSTPHVGREKLKDMVIYNSTLVPVTVINDAGEEEQRKIGGRIIAYDKNTGEELWRYEQADGYWSSPVVVYDESGNGYLVQCDRWGIVRIHDPLNGGNVLAELDLGSRIESTPAVFGDYLVVGTRGTHGAGEKQKIFGVRIK